MNRAVVGYFPVIHQGVLRFLSQVLGEEATDILVPDQDLLELGADLHKNLPALDAPQTQAALKGLYPGKRVALVNQAGLTRATETYQRFIVPNEEVSLAIAKAFLSKRQVRFVDVFIRYDRSRSTRKDPIPTDESITTEELVRTLMADAQAIALTSPDFWRQVGCLLVRDGQTILRACNEYRPDRWSGYAYGDPRSLFSRGESIEASIAIHAEQAVIGTAARLGISTSGCGLVVTTFPCPICAKLIAESGIARVFYQDGYSLLDAIDTLQSRGVDLIRVT